ncbi:metallophosphoesterase [Leeuwenhoekiella sp. W20_SRS_FM14]|uniref:metallophosphoesterase n=1 Tax=Leeuwenhoekiella sp. W20_SRS_FM14 TaxID=3240270 RepID=UPI003F97709B
MSINKHVKHLGLLLGILIFCACKPLQNTPKPVQVAFLSDVHLTDIYGEFSDSDYKGVLNPKTGKNTILRTMQAQLHSTRLFNENYFAFLAALDDVVARGIKYVVFPGDFSDDGQQFNLRGLRKILEEYTAKYGIHFMLTTGNHDPVKPFITDAGKADFMGAGGKQQPIYSKEGLFKNKTGEDLPVIITQDFAQLGYEGILDELKDFGFYPKPQDTYWETPFTNYNYKNYTYQIASNAEGIAARNYTLPNTDLEVPDLSYLVEKGDNIWFLAIDANVYIPKSKVEKEAGESVEFEGAGTGYKNVLTHKKHLLSWIASVTKRAKVLNKQLIVFSHFPSVEFNDDSSDLMGQFFGENKMQLHRVPTEEVSKALAEAGVQLHFAGHMHINDTGRYDLDASRTLFNIQVPSLAAYIPGYKIATIKGDSNIEIETITLDEVPDFDDLFPLYALEKKYLETKGETAAWNAEILNANTYKEFVLKHLEELVRLRFLEQDWSAELKDLLVNKSGLDLLKMTFKKQEEYEVYKAENTFKISQKDLSSWTGYDMIQDFYKLKNADRLALSDIGKSRFNEYLMVCEQLQKTDNTQLQLWGAIFSKISTGLPATHFVIDLNSNTIKDLN